MNTREDIQARFIKILEKKITSWEKYETLDAPALALAKEELAALKAAYAKS